MRTQESKCKIKKYGISMPRRLQPKWPLNPVLYSTLEAAPEGIWDLDFSTTSHSVPSHWYFSYRVPAGAGETFDDAAPDPIADSWAIIPLAVRLVQKKIRVFGPPAPRRIHLVTHLSPPEQLSPLLHTKKKRTWRKNPTSYSRFCWQTWCHLLQLP